MVEAQHIFATMKLVDGREEQDLLESLLEQSKPVFPVLTKNLDYLLATPFRYPPTKNGSRFRSMIDPGVFYAAQSEHTAGAELGYWRWKFLIESPALESLAPNAHTAFQVSMKAMAIDLRQPPYVNHAQQWMHPADYSATQKLAREARAQDIAAIIYQSVRDPEPGWCVALLTPRGFDRHRPHPTTHTWFLSVTRQEVNWRRDAQSMTFSTQRWQSSF